MPDDQRFKQQYLRTLITSSPATPEELDQAKQKIDLYFRSLEKTQKRQAAVQKAKHPGAAKQRNDAKSARVPSVSVKHSPAPQLSAAAKKSAAETRYQKKVHLSWAILFGAIWLQVFGHAVGLDWLMPCLLLIVGAFTWKRILRKIGEITGPGLQDPELVRLALGRVSSNTRTNQIPRWARRCGEGEVKVFRDKWNDLNKWIDQILLTNNLESALGPAEECLGVLNYFDQVRNRHVAKVTPTDQTHETQIDPLNTLIERLIEDHELDWADKLSQHYLQLISPDF